MLLTCITGAGKVPAMVRAALVCAVMIGLCGMAHGEASGQPMPTTGPAATTEPATVASTTGQAATTEPATTEPAATEAVGSASQPAEQLGRVVVTSKLDQARAQIAPSLGATTYTVGPQQINVTPQGENAPFQQVLLRMPSVVMDSFGQEHVRGEHANLTYRVNGVILPEPLSGFGQELDTHLVDSVSLIDGSLPAQFGFRTAGIIDVTTKSGQSLENNEVSLYGGSYNTLQPSFEVGGTKGQWDYFVTGSYKQNSLGIENPTPDRDAIHDDTEQTRLFSYLNYTIDDTSRISILLNASYANFQIPNTPDLPPEFTLQGVTPPNSADTDENQNEQQYYGVVSYQKSTDKYSYQASAFSSYGQIHFTPDPVNDLIYSGVAGDILNDFVTNGFQFDSSWVVNDDHTIRAGLITDYTSELLDTNTSVFPADAAENQTSSVPFSIGDNTHNHALDAGIYIQDEWKLNRVLTLNYGARFDEFDANFDNENQLSPRANLVWKVDDKTTAHAGYARYFVPPPVQNVHPSSIAKFANTTNAPPNTLDDAPKVERSNYYDIGVSHQITEPWALNLDGFYKDAHNLVDEGQFGQAVILTPFNYRKGYVYGADASSTYKEGPVSAFGNFAWVITGGKDIDSQQFTIDNAELDFIQGHYIKLDHESEFTASAGVSYDLTKHDLLYTDILYGSGLRAGFANQDKEPGYYPINMGYIHTWPIGGPRNSAVTLRFDVINVFDQVYQLRNGTGIGVGAPQYGQRRTFLVGLAYDF